MMYKSVLCYKRVLSYSVSKKPCFIFFFSIGLHGTAYHLNSLLSLHLRKTECILFGPTRKLKEVQDFIVSCNNYIIQASDHVKYLGVIIDNHLSGEHIVDSIVQKVNNRLRFLYRKAKF